MTTTAGQVLEQRDRAPSRTWPVIAIYAAASLLLGVADLALPASGWYPWALAAAVFLGSGVPAVIDIRTLTLPNRYTAALAAAAAIQAVTHSWATVDPSPALWAALAAVLATTVYLALGAVGWVGFGDAKLAAGLALAAGIISGPWALFLAPLAIVLSGPVRVLGILVRNRAGHPHGPALVLAAVAIMTASFLWLA